MISNLQGLTKKKTARKKFKNLQIDIELADEFRALSKEYDVTQSKLLRYLIQQTIAYNKGKSVGSVANTSDTFSKG